jgi:hypothetical protein
MHYVALTLKQSGERMWFLEGHFQVRRRSS